MRFSLARSIITVIVPLSALIGGCASGKPQIAVKDVAVGESSDEAVVLNFGVELSNTSDEALKLLLFEYEVEIAGETAFEGIRSAEATLAAQSEREMTLPAVVRRDHAGWAGEAGSGAVEREYSISGRLRYVRVGEVSQVLLETGIVRPSVRFSGRGELRGTSK